MRAVVLDSPAARLRVAGLSLLERMIVAVHRAGAAGVAVAGSEPLPRFRRAAALGISVSRAAEVESSEECLVADGALLAGRADVRRVLEARGQLADAAGRRLPLSWRPAGGSGERPAAPVAVVEPVSVKAPLSATAPVLVAAPVSVTAESPAILVTDEESRKRAERALWASLGTSTDGVLDRIFNRPLGRFASKVLIHTPVSPNVVTILGTVLGLAGSLLIAQGSYQAALWGALVFQLSAALDCVDGEIARVLFKESRLGRWLDLVLDNVVHVAVFAAIIVHCLRSQVGGPVIWFGLSLIAGAVISLVIYVRAIRLPPEKRDARSTAVMDRMANRDFSITLIFFSAIGRLDWFIWLGGVIAHFFWLTAVIVQARGRPARLPREARKPIPLKPILSLLSVAAGLALFFWVAWQAGPASIWSAMGGLGWYALLVPVPQLIAYAFDTLGWRAAFGRAPGVPSLWTLYWDRMAGEAVNLLTPGAYVGGEPLKAYLVQRQGVPGTKAAASVVVAKTLMTVAQVIFLIAGTLCALGSAATGTGLYLGLSLTIAAATAGTVLLVWVQTRQPFAKLLGLARRLGLRLRALDSRRVHIERLDGELRRFYREERPAFYASVGWHFLGWVLGASEIYFGARWLGAPVGALDALALEAFASVIKGATLFVPGSIGFQETGFVFLFQLFHLPAGAAVGFGLLRRARELFCAALGMGFLWSAHGWRGLPRLFGDVRAASAEGNEMGWRRPVQRTEIGTHAGGAI